MIVVKMSDDVAPGETVTCLEYLGTCAVGLDETDGKSHSVLVPPAPVVDRPLSADLDMMNEVSVRKFPVVMAFFGDDAPLPTMANRTFPALLAESMLDAHLLRGYIPREPERFTVIDGGLSD